MAPVHVFGNPADTAAFDALAAQRDVAVVYDAAHGFGALRDGAPVGREGLAQVFSTSPTKLLITGEGGVVATDDDALAERVVVGREYGNPGTYDPLFVGLNARLPEAERAARPQGPRPARSRGRTAQRPGGRLSRACSATLAGLGFQRIRRAGPLARSRTSRCASAPPSSA